MIYTPRVVAALLPGVLDDAGVSTLLASWLEAFPERGPWFEEAVLGWLQALDEFLPEGISPEPGRPQRGLAEAVVLTVLHAAETGETEAAFHAQVVSGLQALRDSTTELYIASQTFVSGLDLAT